MPIPTIRIHPVPPETIQPKGVSSRKIKGVLTSTPTGPEFEIFTDATDPEEAKAQAYHLIHSDDATTLVFLLTGSTGLYETNLPAGGNIELPEARCLLHIGWWEQVRNEPMDKNPRVTKAQRIYKSPTGCSLLEALLMRGVIPEADMESDTLAEICYRVKPAAADKSYGTWSNVMLQGKKLLTKKETKPFPLLSYEERAKVAKNTPELRRKLIEETLQWGTVPGKKLKKRAHDALVELRPFAQDQDFLARLEEWHSHIPREQMETILPKINNLFFQEMEKVEDPEIFRHCLGNMGYHFFPLEVNWTNGSRRMPEERSMAAETEAIEKHVLRFGITEAEKQLLKISDLHFEATILRLEYAGAYPAALRTPDIARKLACRWLEKTPSDSGKTKGIPATVSRRTQDAENSIMQVLVRWMEPLKTLKDPEANLLLKAARKFLAENM